MMYSSRHEIEAIEEIGIMRGESFPKQTKGEGRDSSPLRASVECQRSESIIIGERGD